MASSSSPSGSAPPRRPCGSAVRGRGRRRNATPTTASGVIPGLVVRQNGFTLGEATLIYGGPPQAGEDAGTATNSVIGIQGIIEFKDLRVGVRNFEVNFDSGVSVHGTIFFASGGV